MTEISKIIKEEADWLFNEEVSEVEPEHFDAVYESITGDFRLGAICMASKMKNVFQILGMANDLNAQKVVKYLDEFIEHEVNEVEMGRKYLS